HRQHDRAPGRQALALARHARQRQRDRGPGPLERPRPRDGALRSLGRAPDARAPRRLRARDREPDPAERRGPPPEDGDPPVTTAPWARSRCPGATRRRASSRAAPTRGGRGRRTGCEPRERADREEPRRVGQLRVTEARARDRRAALFLYSGAFAQGLVMVSFAATSAVLVEQLGFSDARYGSLFLSPMAPAVPGALLGGAPPRSARLPPPPP